MEALQTSNNKDAWFSYFIKDAVFTDDGRALILNLFRQCLLSIRKFLTIDKVENDGKTLQEIFCNDNGTFKVFSIFIKNSDGKFNRLDIGQIK